MGSVGGCFFLLDVTRGSVGKFIRFGTYLYLKSKQLHPVQIADTRYGLEPPGCDSRVTTRFAAIVFWIFSENLDPLIGKVKNRWD